MDDHAAFAGTGSAFREAGLRRSWLTLRRRWPGASYFRGIAALVVAYYAAAHLGYAFQFSGPVASVVWLPAGVGIAFLYLRGLQYWPGVVIGDLLVNNYSTLPLSTALAQSAGNLIEVVVATVLIRRLCPKDGPIATLRGVVGMLAAIACGTFLSATIGSLASWLGDVISSSSLPYVWRTWWLGDFSGALIVLPLAISLWPLPDRPWRRARVLEAALVFAAVAALGATQLSGTAAIREVVVFPVLIWAAVRFGPRGAAFAIVIVCAFAIWAATNSLGPFGVGSINERLLDTQVFIATLSLSTLAIAALVSERARLAEGVHASRARLVAASDEARRRLARDLHDGAQQDLIGLRLRLEQATDEIANRPAEARRLIEIVGRQMDHALDSLRSLATGVYPPVLQEHGLTEALKSAAMRAPLPVSVQASRLDRYPEAVELAVYFCCLEALQNVAKHAGPGAQVSLHMWQDRTSLRFEVIDTGVGFDARAMRPGSGLTNMRDRIEVLGGTLTVTSPRGCGTIVFGRVPIG